MKQYANFEEFEQSKTYKLGEPVEIEFADGTSYKRNTRGDQYWYKDGRLHRYGDRPAAIYADGGQYWYKDGKHHRDGDLPAVIYGDGTQFWFKNGKLHRDGDRPAAMYADGNQYWFKNGKEYTPENDLAEMRRLAGLK